MANIAKASLKLEYLGWYFMGLYRNDTRQLHTTIVCAVASFSQREYLTIFQNMQLIISYILGFICSYVFISFFWSMLISIPMGEGVKWWR